MPQPALNFAPDLLLQAQGIKVVFFDVDGVLTDGGLYLTAGGEELKRFHILDRCPRFSGAIIEEQGGGRMPSHFPVEPPLHR